MPPYDTSVFAGHIRGNRKTRRAIEKLHDHAWPVFVSAVTAYELHLGCLITDKSVEHLALIDEYLSHVIGILPVDENVARHAAEIQAELRRRNRMLDIRDLFIAATASVHNLPLCTLDAGRFSRVPVLSVELP